MFIAAFLLQYCVENNKKNNFFIFFHWFFSIFKKKIVILPRLLQSFVYVLRLDVSFNSQSKMSTPSQVRRCCWYKEGIGWEQQESLHFVEKAFTKRMSSTLQTSNTWRNSVEVCNGRCPGMCLYASPLLEYNASAFCFPGYRGTIFILAWASMLLIFQS